MEGVPRMPMLEIDLKQNSYDYSAFDWAVSPNENVHEATQQQIVESLKSHIRSEYGDDPEKYKTAINEFIELQSSVYKAILNPDFDGCNLLKKYYGQLHYMESRFPFTGESAIKVSFAWLDAFTGILTTHDNFKFEQSAILFNIGGIHSILGALDKRSTDEGIRYSCSHFRCAAALFTYISEHFDTTMSSDIYQAMLKLYINLMLAQGQECLVEKSMQDSRKSNIVSKICQQVVEYYEQCLRDMEYHECENTLGSYTYKHWKKVITFKISYYSAITKYYMGNNSSEQEKYGQAIAFYVLAVSHLNDSMKLAKSIQKEFRLKIDEALKFTSDVLNGKHASSVKDNNFVYHDRIPDKSTLPDIKGASLAKAPQFNPSDPSVTGPDIFTKLVPMEAHLAASTYSDEKDKLYRSVKERIEKKDEILEQYKQSIELDPSKIINLEEVVVLNPKLIEKCAELSVDQTSMQQMEEAEEALSVIDSELDAVLNEVLTLIEQEETEDQKLKDTCGEDAFSSQEDVDEIKQELQKEKELHQTASHKNDDLHTACRIHLSSRKLVAGGIDAVKDDLQLTNIADMLTEEDKKDVDLIHKLCLKVVEMEEQRRTLLQQLRTLLDEDDVTSTLVTQHGVDKDELFQEELKKHDSFVDIINKNLVAQDNILSVVTEANFRYAKIRKMVDAEMNRVATREKKLLLSCECYEEVLMKCKEGKEFFTEILNDAQSLLEKTKDLHTKNTERRAKIYKRHEEKERAKRPPPRPSAPKPKFISDKKAPVSQSSAPATGLMLSPDVLAKMMAEDDDDELMNDPEFLKFIQSQGEMFAGAMTPNALGSCGPLTSAMGLSFSTRAGQSLPPHPHTMPPSFYQRAEFSNSTTSSHIMQSAPGPLAGTQSFNPAQNPPQVSSPRVQNFQSSLHDTVPGMPTQPPSSGMSFMSSNIRQASSPFGQQHAQTSQPNYNTGSVMRGSPYQLRHQHPTPEYNSFVAGTNAPTPPNVPQSPPVAMSPRPYTSISQQPNQQYNNFQNVQHRTQRFITSFPSVSVPAQINSYPTPITVNPVHVTQEDIQTYAVPTQVGQNPPQSYSNTQNPVAYHYPSQDNHPQATPQFQLGIQIQPQYHSQWTTQQQPPGVQVSQVAIVYTQPASQQSSSYTYSQPSLQNTVPPEQNTSDYQISGLYPPAAQQASPNMSVVATANPNTYSANVPTGDVHQPMMASNPAVNHKMLQPYQQVPSHATYSSGSGLPPVQAQSAPLLHQNFYQQQIIPVSGMQQHGGQANHGMMSQQHYFGTSQVQATQQYPAIASPAPSVVSQSPSGTYLPQARPVLQQQVLLHHTVRSLSQQSVQSPPHHMVQPLPQLPVLPQSQQPFEPLPQQQVQTMSQQPFQAVQQQAPQLVSKQQNHMPLQTIHTMPQQLSQLHQPVQSVSQQPGQPLPQQPIQTMSHRPGQIIPQHQVQSIPTQRIQPSQQQRILPMHQVQAQSVSQHQLMSLTGQSISDLTSTASTSGLVANSQVQQPQYAPKPDVTTYGPQMQASQQKQSQLLVPRPDINQNLQSSQSFHTTQPSYQQQNNQASNPNQQSSYNQQVATSSAYGGQKPMQFTNCSETVSGQNFLSQQSYTYRSQPHPGSYFSTPSNENSPKHVPVQQNIPRPSIPIATSIVPTKPAPDPPKPMPILTPTPVNTVQLGPPPPLKPSSDLDGLILTPTRTLSTSADELLSTSPDPTPVAVKDNSQVVLVPTKVDKDNDAMVIRPIEGLPYMDDADLMKFKGQVEQFRTKVGNLLHKPESTGLCALDREWKQLSESQEIFSRKLSTAIARCSSYKNRFQDVVPFDQSRVVLKQAKDDYVNASVIDGVSPFCPRFIATQSPLPNTCSDFWLLVYEQQVNLIVMLVHNRDVPKKCPVYWPTDRAVSQQHGPLTVSFMTGKSHGELYIERTFTIKHNKQSLTMSVTLLQYTAWPEHRQPSSVYDLLSFMRVVHNFHSQQRNLQWPVLVHCESGVGHTGAFCVCYAAVNEINAGMGIVDVVDTVTKMRKKRKYIVQEKSQLKFVYDVILSHAIDTLKQRGVTLAAECKVPSTAPQQVNSPTPSIQSPGRFDIFSNQAALSSIQANVEKMTIKTGQDKLESVPNKSLLTSNDQDLHLAENLAARSLSVPTTASNMWSMGQINQNASSIENIIPSETGMSDLVQGTIPIPFATSNHSRSEEDPTVFTKPDVVQSCNDQVMVTAEIDSISSSTSSGAQNEAKNLIDTLTPEAFTLSPGDNNSNRRRVTKADFFKSGSGLISNEDPSDPFSGLDPLWGHKK